MSLIKRSWLRLGGVRNLGLGALLFAFIGIGAVALLDPILRGPAPANGAGTPTQHQPTKGVFPDEAWRPDGEIDWSIVPDFILTMDGSGQLVGYVSRDATFNNDNDAPNPVFADDLKTVVGHMYPGRGFVPLGASPVSVPEWPMETPSSR